MPSALEMRKELSKAHRDLKEARLENTEQRRQLQLLQIKVEAFESGKKPVQRNLCETFYKMEVNKLNKKMSKMEKELASTKLELKVTKMRLKDANQKLTEKENEVVERPKEVVCMDECDLSIHLRDAKKEIAQKEEKMSKMRYANYKLQLEKTEELGAMQQKLDDANKVSELLKNEMIKIREEDRKREEHCDYVVYVREKQIEEIQMDNRRNMVEKNAEIEHFRGIIRALEDFIEIIYKQNGLPREQVVEEDGNDYQMEEFIDVEN